eukprot:229477_1
MMDEDHDDDAVAAAAEEKKEEPQPEAQPQPQPQQHIYKSTPAPAVTSLLKCNALNGVSCCSLDIPLFHFCLEVPSISGKVRSLSNTYRFYSEVICQPNKENKSDKELQISDADYKARNEAYLIIVTHPTLPLYITANTRAYGMRLWHYQLDSFSLPLKSSSKTNKTQQKEVENKCY